MLDCHVGFGCHCWLVQQCEAGTRVPLLGKPDSGTRHFRLERPLGRPLPDALVPYGASTYDDPSLARL